METLAYEVEGRVARITSAHEVLDPRWAALAGFASEKSDAGEDGSAPDKLDE